MTTRFFMVYCLRDGRGESGSLLPNPALRDENTCTFASQNHQKGEYDYESESDLVVASVWSRRASFGANREAVARFEQEDCGVERRCKLLPQPMQNPQR